ncbi:unnamed protein product [Caenorhabditis angaria]|uniref:Uncharacterized protein n=1 Tax=Caenorhabditis angaria TaxID=860376 RepID=A0A9P1N4Y5_9PELO|nr:unnamed protein product [Caenorhabditis angaria]
MENEECAISSMSNCSEATLYIDEDETRIVEAETSGTRELAENSRRPAENLTENPGTSENPRPSETPKITIDVAIQTDPEPPKNVENLTVLEFLLLRDSQKDLEIQNLKSKLQDLETSLQNRNQLRIEELVQPENPAILEPENPEVIVEQVEFPAPPPKKSKKVEPKPSKKPKKLTEVEKLARWSYWKE